MTLDEARENIGRRVVYRQLGRRRLVNLDTGVITSVNDVVVFVRYGDDRHSKATYACDIALEAS